MFPARTRGATRLAALLFVTVPVFASGRESHNGHSAPQAVAIVPSDTAAVAPQYFGLHIHRAVAMNAAESSSVWPPFDDWSWRLWDAHVAWKDLEPRRGVFDFSRLDSLCDRALAKHVRVLLTLGLTPAWASARPLEKSNYDPGNQAPPADIDDWRRYVDTVAKRYRGRIEAYEIWNEPNLRGFFSGSPRELVALARVAYGSIRAADPRAIIVTPSATGVPGGSRWLKQYIAVGGDAYADVVGFHFYVTPRDPEAMLPAIDSVRAILNGTRLQHAPVWNTESGWLLQNHDVHVLPSGVPGTFGSRVLDDTTGAAFVARALVLGRCASLSRFYWYAWDNRRMGLTEANGRQTKLPALAYANVRRWLVGASVRSCRRISGGMFVVELARPGQLPAEIIWSTGEQRSYSLPSGVSLDSRFDATARYQGHARRRRDGALRIGPVPTLVTYRPRSK